MSETVLEPVTATPLTWGRRWPGPARAASPVAVFSLVTGAAVGAASLDPSRAGLGWLITALAGTAALIVARRTSAQPLDPARFGWSAATIVLLAVGTVRDAGWIVALCLLAAVVTGTLAVTGGRSLRAMMLGGLMVVGAGLRAIPWFSRGLDAVRGRGKPGFRLLGTIVVSIVLLVVFGALFTAADPAFADLVDRLTPRLDEETVVRWAFLFPFLGLVLSAAAFLRAAPPDLSGLDGPGKRRVARLEWAIPLGLLVSLFAAFVAVQVTVLFGGTRHVQETTGLTYADYARGGFWQLLIVTGLSLAVVAGAARWAPREAPADRTLIRVLLGGLAGLTLVIVASALHRMDLYADAYGLTRLRLLVEVCEAWLGVVFLLVVAAGVRLRAVWLPRAMVATAVLALLGLAASNPDAQIANRNISRYQQTHRLDVDYLSRLSADAVPALRRLPTEDGVCAIGRNLQANPDDWRSWNYARTHAREETRGCS